MCFTFILVLKLYSLSGGIEEELCAAFFLYREGQEINLVETFGSLAIAKDVTNKDNLIESHGKFMDVPCNSRRQIQCGFKLDFKWIDLTTETPNKEEIKAQFGEDPDGGKA